jgi:hypothetical protein
MKLIILHITVAIIDDDDGYDNSLYRDLDEDGNDDNSPPLESNSSSINFSQEVNSPPLDSNTGSINLSQANSPPLNVNTNRIINLSQTNLEGNTNSIINLIC